MVSMIGERIVLIVTTIVLIALLIAGLSFWGRGIIKSRKGDLLMGSSVIAGILVASFALFGTPLVFSVVGILLFIFGVETLILSAFSKKDCPIRKKERIGLAVAAVLLACAVATVDRHPQFGNPLSKDKVVALYERPPKDIWEAAKDVIRLKGVLSNEDVMEATLLGTVDGREVWIKVDQNDPKYTKLTVRTRTRYGGADMALAGEMDKQIAIRLATSRLRP